jgi:tetratricopeptide (TPR) repeat protein
MMSKSFHEKLAEVKEQQLRLSRAENRRKELQQTLKQKERLVFELELELAAEQEDVDKLMGLSLANLFHTVLRSKEEQLELERQQVLTAALKLQEAKQAMADAKAGMLEADEDLHKYADALQHYRRLMAERERELRSSPESAARMLEEEEAIADKSLLLKELDEAKRAGAQVAEALEEASVYLDKARNWGNWDLWGGGGVISTHIKHGHIDDARDCIRKAMRRMRDFQTELADLKRGVLIEIDISDMLKMGDYWFDGLITDWLVQGRIRSAGEQVLDALRRLRPAVAQLERERASAERELQAMQRRRTAWIEGS